MSAITDCINVSGVVFGGGRSNSVFIYKFPDYETLQEVNGFRQKPLFTDSVKKHFLCN